MTEHVHPSITPPGGGGHFLMGMCRWKRVAHFRIFGVRTVPHIYGWQTYQNICSVGEKESVLRSIYFKNGLIHLRMTNKVHT